MKTDSSIPSSADELSYDIIRIAKKHGIKDINAEYNDFIKKCITLSGISSGNKIHEKIYSIDSVLDVISSDVVVDEFNKFFLNDKYLAFSQESIHKRNIFDKSRAGNFMYTVASRAFPEHINLWTPGQVELLFTKYIIDRMNYEYLHYSQQDCDIEYYITYEDLYGNHRSISVISEKALDVDILLEKPEDHWVGTTYFDSFYMYPFYSENDSWVFIPVSLIRSISVKILTEDGEDVEYE